MLKDTVTVTNYVLQRLRRDQYIYVNTRRQSYIYLLITIFHIIIYQYEEPIEFKINKSMNLSLCNQIYFSFGEVRTFGGDSRLQVYHHIYTRKNSTLYEILKV